MVTLSYLKSQNLWFQGLYFYFIQFSFPYRKIILLARLASQVVLSVGGSECLKILYEMWHLFKWICSFAVPIPCWVDSSPWDLLSISMPFHSSLTKSLICLYSVASWGFLFLRQWSCELMYISQILLGRGLGHELERCFPFTKGCIIIIHLSYVSLWKHF